MSGPTNGPMSGPVSGRAGGSLRVGIAGAGIAGTLLAWRIKLADRGVHVALAGGTPPDQPPDQPPGQSRDRPRDQRPGGGSPGGGWPGRDATAASGGQVRGYDPDPGQLILASSALAELLGSRLLRAWSRYVEVGSIYVRHAPPDPAALVELRLRLPGSAYAADPGEAAPGAFPGAGHAVVERHAGHISPDGLRHAALLDFVRMGGRHLPGPVTGMHAAPDGTVSWLSGGERHSYDIAVIAAGPWTPRVVAEAGLDPGGLRTKLIQYGLYEPAGAPNVPAAFVDETTGLYGRPCPDGGLLLGVPSDRFGVDPVRLRPDAALVRRTGGLARRAFPGLSPGRPLRVVVAADCYADPPGLRLRPVADGPPNLLTFTGGSGGAAKTALAAARHAARDLLRTPVPA